MSKKSKNEVKKTQQTKQKGLFLWIIIVLLSLDWLFSIPSLLQAEAKTAGIPDWIYPYVVPFRILSFFLLGVGVYGIWKWKKWGAWFLAADGFLTLLLVINAVNGTLTENHITDFNSTFGLFFMIFIIFFPIFWLCFWAIARRWRYFE